MLKSLRNWQSKITFANIRNQRRSFTFANIRNQRRSFTNHTITGQPHINQKSHPIKVPYDELAIFDTFGVIIPASWDAMKKTFQQFGVHLTTKDIQVRIRSSKRDHIAILVKDFFCIKNQEIETRFINNILEKFAEIQLAWFKDNSPVSTKIIDLFELKEFQKSKNAVVVTSMFPKPIMDLLIKEFNRQEFFPNSIFSVSSDTFSSRTGMVEKALELYPAKKTTFYVDTVADAKEIKNNFPAIDIVGVIGYSAEYSYNLSQRFLQEANATDIIHSFSWKYPQKKSCLGVIQPSQKDIPFQKHANTKCAEKKN